MKLQQRRLGLLLALSPGLLCVCLAGLGGEKTAGKNQTFDGQVVPLKEVLAKSGIVLDADVNWLALVADDGKVYPLIKDAGSRMFFTDAKLLRRPMRLTSRLVSDSNLMQV